MPAGARRRPARSWLRFARRALPMLCLWLAGQAAADSSPEVVSARYVDPTARYPHAVLGDALEFGTLELVLESGETRGFTLPWTSVFEDVAPRLADVDGDGQPEVITVESDSRTGARLALYGPLGRVAATPYIGTRFRWLAPLGAADLDGDGQIEIAYLDRPHLAKTLRLWRYARGELVAVADLSGVTNHRIGETDIAGGIRHCAGAPEMILASADWSRLLAVRFDGAGFSQQVIGADTRRAAFAAAMACAD